MNFDFQQPQQLIEAGPAKLAYWKFGEGPDLVFIHGWPLTSATFVPLLNHLAPHFCCHLFDLPGMGHSEWPLDKPFGLDAHADALALAIEKVGLQKYTMVSHDSGATVARLVAVKHGVRVSGLVMGNTEIPHHRPWRLQLFLLLGKLPGGKAMLSPFLRFGFLRRSTLGLGPCFDDARYGDGEFFERQVQPLLQNPKAFAGQMRLVEHFDWKIVDGLEQAHRQINCPTLLIWGARDPYFPLPKAKAMLAEFAGPAEIRVVERGKLYVHEDFAEEFAGHMLSFLSEDLSKQPKAVA